MSTVALWPVKPGRDRPWLPFAWPPSRGCVAAGSEPDVWPALELVAALRRRFEIDTWFQPVSIDGYAAWPRLAKMYLIEELGAPDAWLHYAVLDLDRPDHRSDPWASSAAAAAAVIETSRRLDCAVYATRGGLRAIFLLASPIPLRLAQSFLTRFVEGQPDDLPVPVDYGVKDWTRGYRVPWCPRVDGKPSAWGNGPPPMQLQPLLDRHTINWSEDGLADEYVAKSRPVKWPEPGPFETREERRIMGLLTKFWLPRLQNAPSRHEVLLAAATHLGGLCAYHGVSPEPFVDALAEATDSANAIRTVRTALAYGANSPIALPS